MMLEDSGFTITRGKLGGEENRPLTFEDDSRLCWLLLRARDEDGKYRFLLQQRPDGSWGMPGGKPHLGEDAWAAAIREVTEEIGHFPPPQIAGTFHHVEDDGTTQVYLWLCDVPYFHPALDGSTPDETAGAAWFRRKEIAALDLAPKFRDDWEHGIALKDHVTKALRRMVSENGETLTLTDASQRLQAAGARWPYPHRADGSEWPDAGPGAVPGELGSAGGEPPNRINDFAEGTHSRVYPRGGKDSEFPRRRTRTGTPATRFPEQGEQDQDEWPYPQVTLQPPVSTVGAPKGARPVTGSGPAEAPQGYRPHSYEPQAFDPGLCAVCSTPEGNVIHSLPGARKGAADPGDPNPVEAFHVYSQLLGNFPPKALGWVQSPDVRWIGPVAVPHDRIDYGDEASWAAAHEPARVRHFAGQYRRGEDVQPGVSVQKPGKNTINVEDGHHRCLGSRQAGKPFLTYIGFVPQDAGPWDELHSSQLHQGDDPANR
jgi:8-oxo-dGTP pyrophosphatase MutT (NUDIX family)